MSSDLVERSGSGCASHLRWGMRDRAGKLTGGDGIGAEEQHGKEWRRRCVWVRILPRRRHDFGEVARMKAWPHWGVLSWEIKEERSVRGIWLELKKTMRCRRIWRGFGMREGAAGGPSECLPMRGGGGEGVGNPTNQMYMTRKG
uniref:Uncharacterized protein n=1 Tax=Oryza barthii TaxID=65489 RepID=A0A0D3FUX0_9ORYZ